MWGSLFKSVFFSYSYRNKLPHTGWLKRTEIDSLTVLEAGSAKSRCQQGRFLLEILKENPFLVSILAPNGYRQCLAFLGL